MSISSYPSSNDPVIGTNDPMFGNTWDQVNIDIETALEIEHSNGGIHTDLAVLEIGTYSGDGNNDRTISLTATNLIIKYIEILRQSVTQTDFEMRSDSMTGDNTKQSDTGAFVADYIQSIGTGSFEIGTNAAVNDASSDYFYRVWGTMSTMPSDSATFTPSWVQHGEAIDTTLQQRVPSAILSRFRYGHNDDGTHKLPPLKITTGTYTGNGSATGPIITPDITCTLKKVLIWRDGAYYPQIKTDNMAGALAMGLGGTYHATWIAFLGDGTFQIKSSDNIINQDSITYYYVIWGL